MVPSFYSSLNFKIMKKRVFRCFYIVLFCANRGLPLFLFERKPKKKQKPFRFIDGAESFGIPFDVLFSCLSHGRRTQKLPSSKSVAVSLCAKMTFGINFQFAMGVHKPLTPGEVPSFRGGEGFALSVASAPALPRGEPFVALTFGTNFGALMDVHPP